LEHRLAQPSDFDEILEVIADARAFLTANGINQWQNGQPGRETFTGDINNGNCHVFMDGSKIVGDISVFLENDPFYEVVYDGKWLTSDTPYAVFHRVAVRGEYRGNGISAQMLSFTENYARKNGFKSIRGDTHRDNRAMRRLLEKCGYIHCGTIHMNEPAPGDIERVCYEKIVED